MLGPTFRMTLPGICKKVLTGMVPGVGPAAAPVWGSLLFSSSLTPCPGFHTIIKESIQKCTNLKPQPINIATFNSRGNRSKSTEENNARANQRLEKTLLF